MPWYNYLACFLAGAFFTNAVPHFVHGVSGDRFPTPFANPPGKGLSSPALNVVWALINLSLGALVFWAGKMTFSGFWSVLAFFIGMTAMSFRLSVSLARKHSQSIRQGVPAGRDE
jgi:hypothetical protein